jgi:hypothetical protein
VHIWNYYDDTNATGTKLIRDPNTSVFFENWNTNANWYTGFTNPINSWNAGDCRAQWKAWNGGQIYIVNSAGQLVPNNGIITGSLVNYGIAAWHLDKVLLKQ